MNNLTTSSLAQLAQEINGHHQQCEQALQTGLQHARQAGLLLVQAKAQIPHGGWLPWVQANCDMTERSAQRYMMIANRWDELTAKTTRVSHLTYREGLRLLAEPAGEPEAKPVLPLPPLRAGERYVLCGELEGSEAFVEVDPHPDHPGYWTFALYNLRESDPYADYLGRGVSPKGLTEFILPHLAEQGFRPDEDWIVHPVDPSREPQAVTWRREDFEQMLANHRN